MRLAKLGVIVAAVLVSGVLLFAAASYPSSVKSFTTKLDGATISASHINDIQDEVVAIETGLLNGLAHDLKFTDALYDIGKSGATRPRDGFFSRVVNAGTTVTAGTDVVATDQLFERARATAVGEWQTFAYVAGNFTASTGNWTVDDADELVTYMLVGKTLFVTLSIASTDVSATPTTLKVLVPGSFTAATAGRSTSHIVDAGTGAIGTVRWAAAGTSIDFDEVSGAYTATSSDNTNVYAQIAIEVQ